MLKFNNISNPNRITDIFINNSYQISQNSKNEGFAIFFLLRRSLIFPIKCDKMLSNLQKCFTICGSALPFCFTIITALKSVSISDLKIILSIIIKYEQIYIYIRFT